VIPVDQRDAAVRAYLDDVFNGHNLGSLDKYWIEDLVSHWMGDRSLHGLPAWREAMAGFFNAFPDAAYTLHDLFFSGGKGVWRGHLAGDPAQGLGRNRRDRPEGNLDRHHHRQVRGREAGGGLG
jgi:predicted ester cyclase